MILQILKEPHPAHDQPWIYLRTIGIISLCIFLIIWLMEPFNAKVRYDQSVLTMAAIYASAGFICMLLNYSWILIFPQIFAQKNWTLGKEILILIYELSTVAMVVAFISKAMVNPSFEPISYPKAWLIVFVEGILPYLVAILIKHIYLLKKNLNISQNINQLLPISEPTIGSQSAYLEGIPTKILVQNFLFAESQGNYLLITYVEGANIVEYKSRLTISDFFEKNARFQNIFRCHRAFVINLKKVDSIAGNAAGYELSIPPAKNKIYVSRHNIEKFKQNLEKIKNQTE